MDIRLWARNGVDSRRFRSITFNIVGKYVPLEYNRRASSFFFLEYFGLPSWSPGLPDGGQGGSRLCFGFYLAYCIWVLIRWHNWRASVSFRFR